MITRYGMSDNFDMVALETVQNQYLGGRHLPCLLRRDLGPNRPAGGGAGKSPAREGQKDPGRQQ